MSFITELKSRRNLSFSEESDLSCDDVLERSSQKSKADVSERPKTPVDGGRFPLSGYA